jgi:pimeloyl-ACP methyl ester carboxylesterase
VTVPGATRLPQPDLGSTFRILAAREASSKGDRDELICDSFVHARRLRFRLRGAEPPTRFSDTFTSRHVDSGELRLHSVIGGDGPPLLLIHGWPGTWCYWRLVMPALAREFRVVAVDQRGIGLSTSRRRAATPERSPTTSSG